MCGIYIYIFFFKREIFVAGIFTEIKPVWEGDLETRPKNLKSLCLVPYITLYFWVCFSAVGYSAKKIKIGSAGIHPIIFLLQITTTSNKCEILNNLNLKVGGSRGES